MNIIGDILQNLVWLRPEGGLATVGSRHISGANGRRSKGSKRRTFGGIEGRETSGERELAREFAQQGATGGTVEHLGACPVMVAGEVGLPQIRLEIQSTWTSGYYRETRLGRSRGHDFIAVGLPRNIY